ncbi:DNA translocase FtsK 4TM domain-containing protein [Imperialibacter roseus]|uniref:DNA translocase FtsK 4TM domain-containing protein n=1 Tax=Imperialibacter roseus TaxID=1324217 RepID=A0ABZ0ISX5_9BACT|nr:DNA translocase FtsK 4TM domain-containing protein [Imperialibacter roseus]WOK08143.1 DNA translocase FtsK 4TM domain-containing protein [Imperialibacter roseus]
MAKNTFKTNNYKKEEPKKESTPLPNFFKDKRTHLVFGFFLLILSIFLFVSFFSYLFSGKADQSVVESFMDTGIRASGSEIKNWLGLLGAVTSHFFIFKWFGIACLLVPPFLFIVGFKILFGKYLLPPFRVLSFSLFFIFWTSLLLGFFLLSSNEISEYGFLSGGIGYELALIFNEFMGWGTFLFLVFAFLAFNIYFFNITKLFTETVPAPVVENEAGEGEIVEETEEVSDEEELESWTVNGKENEEPIELALDKEPPVKEKSTGNVPLELLNEEDLEAEQEVDKALKKILSSSPKPSVAEDVALEVEEVEEEVVDGKLANYDPTLDLPKYKYPTPELLNDYPDNKVKVTKEELEANKDKIVETLTNFKIGISSIKATIGPTVTLYEIVPDAGVKISKIKNLEDDIALSLAALGIRIIAPIPGRGTIGIEVPNKNREMVDMKSVIMTEKFMKSDKELPVVLGKTISNEVFVLDLAKMPHMLMAGATGQGKSVGINVLLTSLIYKKHPSQLKFVLVDPKKVELTLFNTIERHFLAKLPNSEEAIITDTKKVIFTLNSLCIEMDQRYDLLKDAACRNIKEYNGKFVNRKLLPTKGHRFLPYIVVVIDELADLMMTAGKEIETPIARLAQLARAIGIHLVVATQRPSVNVITGVIKANFPARLSFRVASKIDSRTILDAGGADQLVGMGDMLLSTGSDIIRLQCAFVDTPEVERVCEFIAAQRGYDTAYILPEFDGDEGGESGVGEVDLSDRDALFDEAAKLIVMHQQGSTSLIQRKMKLGYNRAGRLIDQLEAAGIVGPFEGSKAREVLVKDEMELEFILKGLDN